MSRLICIINFKNLSMKKIFTLIFSLGILSSASLFAQSQYAYVKPVSSHAIVISTGFHRWAETYSFTRYERDMQLAKIRDKYNDLVRSVINSRYLNATQKVKLIADIEQEKIARIKAVNEHFNDERNKYNDWFYDRNFKRIR